MIAPRSFSLAAIAVLYVSTWTVHLQLQSSSWALAFAPSKLVSSRKVSVSVSVSVSDSPGSLGIPLSALHASAGPEPETEPETESEENNNGLSPKDQKVYELLGELYESNLPFRIVVVGNGAILESTNPLGPTFKLGHSPKTGNAIVTFAAEDQSFEFHVMPTQVASAVFVEKESPATGKIMRLIRLVNADGGSIASLILAADADVDADTDADESEAGAASEWFGGMTEKYGSDVVF